MAKIRVNTENSKVINGKLFISLIKVNDIKNKLLKELINTGSNIIHPIMGRMVSYEGQYIRINN